MLVVAVLFITGDAAVGIGAVAAWARLRRADGEDGEGAGALHPSAADGDSDAPDDRQRGIQRALGEVVQSPDCRPALRGAVAGLDGAHRNWRGPGFRAGGLRHVDARTGGPISVRSAWTGVMLNQVQQSVAGPRSHRGRSARGPGWPNRRPASRRSNADTPLTQWRAGEP